MLNEILKTIDNNPKLASLFKYCPLYLLERIKKQDFPLGKFQLFQGNPHEFTYLLVSGQIKVYLMSSNGKSVVLDIYGPGMFIGEQEAIIQKPYSASITNITDVTLLRMANNDFNEWRLYDQQFANKLIYNLSFQIYNLTQRTERYSLHSATEQIITFLIKEKRQNHNVSREQLTFEVDTSYRNINRILQNLVDLNFIAIKNGKIHILNEKELVLIATGTNEMRDL